MEDMNEETDNNTQQQERKIPMAKFIALAIMLNLVLFFILLLLVLFIYKKGVSFLSVMLLMVCPMAWLALAVVIFKKMIDRVSSKN